MSTIRKKTWPESFKLIKSGKKKFDLRMPDFKIKTGDTLLLEEYNPKTKKYTGRKISKRVKYILKFGINDFGQKKEIEKKGLYIIQF